MALLLSIILCLCSFELSVSSHRSRMFHMDTCINSTHFDKIDALTPMPNGKMFLINHPFYWMLDPGEAPSMGKSQNLERVLSEDTISDNVKKNMTHKFAVVNVGMKAVNDRCLPTNQTIVYRMILDSHKNNLINTSIIELRNDNSQIFKNIQHYGYLNAASDIKWKRPVSSISYWNEMIIIFQDDHFVSVRCEHGKWIQILSKPIREVFPGLPTDIGNPNTVMVRDSEWNNGQENKPETELTKGSKSGTVFIFYGQNFYRCDATGNALCEGPYELLSDLLNMSQACQMNDDNVSIVPHTILLSLLVMVVIFIIYLQVSSTFKYKYFVSLRRNDRQPESSQIYYKKAQFSPEYSDTKSGIKDVLIQPTDLDSKPLNSA